MGISPEFVARVLEEKDDDAPVRAGMELISWGIPEPEWHALLEQATERLAHRESRVPGAVFVGSLGIGGLLTWLTVEASVLVPVGPLVVGTSAVTFAGLALMRIFSRQGHAQTLRSSSFRPAPRVLATSTGIIAGRAVALWSGTTTRLRAARLEIGPPVRVVLEFRRRGLRGGVETWELPVPPEAVSDADELVTHLQGRIAGHDPSRRPGGVNPPRR